MEPLATPERYWTTSAEEALCGINQSMLEFSGRWMGDCGALLMGPTGCGKSLAAATAMRRLTLCKARYWAAWVRADALSRMFSNRDNAADICRIKSAHLIVIDDLGYERFAESALEVIGDRYDRDLPTVVTTGLKSSEFCARYSTATARKITEVGRGYAVNVWGDAEIVVPCGTVPGRILVGQSEREWSGRQSIDLSDDPRFA